MAFGSAVVVTITSDDAESGHWLEEYLSGWFLPSAGPADWSVGLVCSADAYSDIRASRPLVAAPRPCFAFDTHTLFLDSWHLEDRLILEDTERSCFLSFAPYRVDLVGDPRTNRWRFTAALLLLEIAATRMRRASVDLHASAVATPRGGLILVGPKGSGKTTLLFHLLRSGGCRMLANDRVFATPSHPSPHLVGAPTAVKIRSATVAQFPELRRGLPAVERPYLHSMAELAGATTADQHHSTLDLALSPPQVLRQLGVKAQAVGRMAAIVFPRLDATTDTWAVEPTDPATVAAGLRANLYGSAAGREAETVIEAIDGGRVVHGPQLFEQLAGSVPGYHLILGPGAYEAVGLASTLAGLLSSE